MATILFNQTVYGPVHSRRLGTSLGVNLSPADGKRCTFNCIYCECGLNEERKTASSAPSRDSVRQALAAALLAMKNEGDALPDVITFSGNGEPTMHPDFPAIIDDTLRLRDELAPAAKVAVLSNSTMLHRQDVIDALLKVDDCLMKFDAADDGLIDVIDQPVLHGFTAEKLIEQLRLFDGRLTVQSIFLRGEHRGVSFDNTSDANLERWIAALKRISPRKVMIYTLDRETPVKTLAKISPESLHAIADRVREAGFEVSVSL